MTTRARAAAALAVLAAAGAPSAHAAQLSPFAVAERLVQYRVAPDALVPTYVPPALATGGGHIEEGYAQGRVFSLRIVHSGRGGPDGVIALSRCAPIGSAPFGRCAGFAATRRDFVRNGFRAAPTRVRGRAGLLLTRRLGRLERYLMWREDGLVLTMGSGTPGRVSLAELRRTATGLDHVRHRYVGGSADPQSSAGAVLVAGDRFVTGHVDWDGACADGSVRGGATDLVIAPRRGDAFSAPVSADGWSGTVSGTVGATTATVDVRAAGVFDGVSCDTGALTLTLSVADHRD